MAWLLYAFLVIYVNNYQGVVFIVGHPSIYIFAQAIMFYANYSYFIPFLLARKKLLLFVLANMLCIAGLVALAIPSYHGLRNWYIGSSIPFHMSYSEQFILRFFELLLFVLFACIVRFTVDWFSFQQKTRNMENVQLKTELAYLRSQLNPHFLFNTLNALYALSLRKSTETPGGIMQLSQLMRYALYETAEERVKLSRELEMIENFLQLQRLRLPLDFPIQYEVRGAIDDHTIEPFLLMPLVENVFKHGAEFATITVTIADNALRLQTHNGVQSPARKEAGGIGLTNLRKRLSLLYPDKHFFLLEENAGRFQTTLSLTLN